MDASNKTETTLHGIAASPGIAHGRAFVVVQAELEIPVYPIDGTQRESEIQRFEQALLMTRQQITKMQQEIARSLGEDEARIFDAHLMVLEDQALIAETIREIDKTMRNVETCFREVGLRYVEAFGRIDDEYLRERASDIRDVVERVLHNLTGRAVENLSRIAGERVLLTRDITTSGSAGLDKSGILGLVTEAGSRTSHAVIMARSMKIPAVVGVHEGTQKVAHGDWVIVDGYDGIIVVNPSEQTLFRYGKLQIQRRSFEKKMMSSARQPAQTLDNKLVGLQANIETADEIERAREAGAEGVGLYRTEFLFLQDDIVPSEDFQYENYRRVAEYFGEQPVVIRSIDLGGDKPVRWASFGDQPEANPFLGFRAIRFCLENVPVFKAQLRAILRASAHGNVKLMFPMISGMDELNRALAILAEAKAELQDRGVPFNPAMPVGSMIEIPSAAVIADVLATRCDFFSVGTNDLIQYLLAVDRVNPRTAHLYEPAHPAVLRTLKHIFDAAHHAGKKVCVCGEMAADPLMVPLLLGLGADELSISPAGLTSVKYLIQHMKMSDAVKFARESLKDFDGRSMAMRALDFYNSCVSEIGTAS
ncbi:MAG: phosphoenolpyruvate--protein phosphotransferase [Opitutaceae bacterium]